MFSDNKVVVLLADDDPDDRALTIAALEPNLGTGDVRSVNDGEELMDYLLRRGAYADPASAPRPGMILLDLNMPRMDGREALNEIKADADLCRIPVIVLTASDAESDIVRSYEMGINAFITKPVSSDDLADAVRTIGEFWFDIVKLPVLAL